MSDRCIEKLDKIIGELDGLLGDVRRYNHDTRLIMNILAIATAALIMVSPVIIARLAL